MHTSGTKMPWTVAGAALLLASVLLAGTTSRVAGEEVGVEVKPVRVEQLLNVPGKTLTAVVHSRLGWGLRGDWRCLAEAGAPDVYLVALGARGHAQTIDVALLHDSASPQGRTIIGRGEALLNSALSTKTRRIAHCDRAYRSGYHGYAAKAQGF
jgi:hypothetical protein